ALPAVPEEMQATIERLRSSRTDETASAEDSTPEQAEPEQAEPEQVEPEQVESEQVEPEQVEPEQAEPEPEQAESEQESQPEDAGPDVWVAEEDEAPSSSGPPPAEPLLALDVVDDEPGDDAAEADDHPRLRVVGDDIGSTSGRRGSSSTSSQIDLVHLLRAPHRD
ncbi:MAG: hypothetical protein ABGZ36_09940, partial [Actinomycetota bacterium]